MLIADYQSQFPPSQKLRHLSYDWSGRRVTEVGCNAGMLAPYVLARGAVSYLGSDYDRASVLRARETVQDARTTFVSAHIPEAPVGDDVLCAFGVFHHVPNDALLQVFATARDNGVRTIIFENPFEPNPAHPSYHIRSHAWYLDTAARHGFIHSSTYQYGFTYPVDRRIVVVSVDAWDVAPRVDLAKHPEYWRALERLPAAMAALVHHDDPTAYIAHWEWKTGRTMTADVDHLPYLRSLVAELREHGYRPAMQHPLDTRTPDFARDGHGPITVVRSGTGVAPRDGAHRACILKALGRDVTACLWRGAK